jgi:HEAT repeat protein
MSSVKAAGSALVIIILLVSVGLCQSLDDNWNDFLHYLRIGRFDLAKGYAQAILESNPDPVKLYALIKENPQGYDLLLKVKDIAPDAELSALSGKLLDIIERGNFAQRSDSAVIIEEISRLNRTDRGYLTAVKRLRSAGEYAIPYMIDVLLEPSRRQEYPNIIRALPSIGKEAINPLVAALQTDNAALRSQIIAALGQIGYPQSLAYLKFAAENDTSAELRGPAGDSINKIDPSALKTPAAQLFYRLAESYYYHDQSLSPAQDANLANIWFWDAAKKHLNPERVNKKYFNELMAMRCCEWALKADAKYGPAIGLWLASFFKAESAGVGKMPEYFGKSHADALVYATTAGVEYLHQALARAVKDKDAYVALGVIEALAVTAGEKSLLYRVGKEQPVITALSFNSRPVRYSAAIAIGAAGPKEAFPESKLVAANLAAALEPFSQPTPGSEGLESWNEQIADSYALRAATVMLQLAQARNSVIDLSLAQDALIKAARDPRQQIQVLAGRILAYLGSPAAQRAIAEMALNTSNAPEVRITAFDSLANSAKLNANMLTDETIDAIYSLISSDVTDANLRSAAAAAYGALNLPSQKVKDLILDQAKS